MVVDASSRGRIRPLSSTEPPQSKTNFFTGDAHERLTAQKRCYLKMYGLECLELQISVGGRKHHS